MPDTPKPPSAEERDLLAWAENLEERSARQPFVLINSAKLWQMVGDGARAETVLAAAVARGVLLAVDPYVEILLKNHGFAAARTFLETFVRQHPKEMLRLARLHRRTGITNKALHFYGLATRNELPGAAKENVVYLRRLGLHREALTASNALVDSPAELWKERVEIFEAMGDQASLELALKSLFRTDVQEVDRLAQFLLGRHRPEEAKQVHLEAIDRGRFASVIPAAQITLAIAKGIDASKDGAEDWKAFLSAEAIDLLRIGWQNKIPAALVAQAALLVQDGRADEAEMLLEEGATQNQSLLLPLAHRYAMSGKDDQAEQTFLKAFDLGINGSYQAIHHFYLSRGNATKALEISEIAAGRHDNSATVNLARYYRDKGDVFSADFFYSFALSSASGASADNLDQHFAPPSTDVLREYAVFLAKTERLDQALELFDKWIDRGENRLLFDRAELLQTFGDKQGAEEDLVRATQLLVEGSFETLALFLKSQDRHEEAASLFAQAFDTGLSQTGNDLKALAKEERALSSKNDLGLG